MGFGTLALIATAGLVGPLLASKSGWNIPVILGELLAGIVLGATGVNWLDADDSTLTFLADIGFALVMFVAGSHVPIRDPQLRKGIGKGAARAALVGLVAAALGTGIAALFNTGNAALYAVLMASSSAALVFPIVDSLSLTGPSVLQVLPQVAIADAACIVALPLVIDPAHAGRAALGSAAVIGCAAALFFILRYLERTGVRRRVHRISERRKYAVELRVNLAILFALAALATSTHVSIMLAGFSFGVAVAAIGAPRRLAKQLFAITEGFLGPLFFIWLGASLNIRDLAAQPSLIGLGLLLGVGALSAHVIIRLTGQPIPIGALACAQLGVPVAAATLATQFDLLGPGEAPAMILGALVTIAVSTTAAGFLARRRPVPLPPPDDAPTPSPSST